MKVLILSPIEIFLEPRLRKAATCFTIEGYEVFILTCLKTPTRIEEYEKLKLDNPNWNWIEIDLRKKSIKSFIRWALSRSLQKICFNFYKLTQIDLSHKFGILNDAFYTSPQLKHKFEIVYTNLIDFLPFAYFQSIKNNAKLIYDSQEYFSGQYSVMDKTRYNWVVKTESQLIGKCDLVIATTHAMKDALVNKYPKILKIIRCRNMPLRAEVPLLHRLELSNPIRIIWHGKSINIKSERGLHLIIECILEIDSDVELYIQGSIQNSERKKLLRIIEQSRSKNKIHLLPPAEAKNIINSILDYDIGYIGEIPTEENQLLTSSNKLFDYISAGLAVLAPKIPGIQETTSEYNNSIDYKEGSVLDLKLCLNEYLENKNLLLELKSNSIIASKKCFWEKDFQSLFEIINCNNH
jgi:glycosyltransferase involved in cell wall biosynthesis